jgi:hypothetical protein
MRALYVAGGEGVRLRLDGPSLVVDRPGRARQRFPLERLSYVVLCGTVEADYRVLRACLASRIPVAAFDATGAACGFFLPWQAEAPRPSVLLESFLERSNWHSHYSDWRRSQERRAIIRALRAAGLPPLQHEGREAAARALLALYRDAEAARRVLRGWRDLSAPLIHRTLAEKGLCPTLIAGRRPEFDLPSHLASINAWAHYRALRELGTMPENWAAMIAGYENIRPRDEQRIRALIDNFLFWLGGARWR